MRSTLTTCLCLLIGYSIFIELVPPSAKGTTVSQETFNRQTVERYRFRINPVSVIVGSSLSARFVAPEIGPCLYDLSIAGGSAFTGLDIIIQKPAKPKVVLIEVNLLERPVDSQFTDAPLPYRRLLPITWVENSPISRFLSLLASFRETETQTRVPVLAAPLQLQQRAYAKPIDQATVSRLFQDLRHRVAVLKAQGITSVLFEMPLHPSLMNKVRSRQIRSIVTRALPDTKFIPAVQLEGGEPVTTTDGIHLQPFEADRILRRLMVESGVPCGEEQ